MGIHLPAFHPLLCSWKRAMHDHRNDGTMRPPAPSSPDTEYQEFITPTKKNRQIQEYRNGVNLFRASLATFVASILFLGLGLTTLLRKVRYPALQSVVHRDWHPKERKDRFPSVDERVRLYMSDWYLPPCNASLRFRYKLNPPSESLEYETINIQQPSLDHNDPGDSTVTVSSQPISATIFDIRNKTLGLDVCFHQYCDDFRSDAKILGINVTGPPVLACMGDTKPENILLKSNMWAPMLAKYRGAAASRKDLVDVTACGSNGECHCTEEKRKLRLSHRYQNDLGLHVHSKDRKMAMPFSPIVWKLHVARHFGSELGIARKHPIAWEDKIPKAIWRGTFSGRDLATKDERRDIENACQYIPRCNFVKRYNTTNDMIDAGFHFHMVKNEMYKWADENGLRKDKMTIEQQLQYKILISLEGNDVASGLKWMLLSNSVVLMPPPTRTSWAMEELLEPFVHYVPMAEDGSDTEEKVQWILDNDMEAQRIAERATLFMEDMLYHPDAEKDELEVKKEIVRRYRAHWQPIVQFKGHDIKPIEHVGEVAPNDDYRSPVQKPKEHEALLDSRNLPPVTVMERYIKWHGGDVLRRELRDENSKFHDRKYAVGFYSCPLQAGNRLHHFFNGLLWSILTNRTMLWKYWDRDTCLKYDGRYYTRKICTMANNVEDCNSVLRRKPWLPSYDEFVVQKPIDSNSSHRFFLEGNPYEVPYFATHHPNVSTKNSKFPWKDSLASAFGVDNATKYPQSIVIFPQERFKDKGFARAVTKEQDVLATMLETEYARKTAKELYSLGVDFLYGMLHRYSFDFTDWVLPSDDDKSTLIFSLDGDDNRDTSGFATGEMNENYKIALHSRHRYPEIDGCDIEQEIKCIRKIFRNVNGPKKDISVAAANELTKKKCILTVMSDRECTVKRIITWLKNNYGKSIERGDTDFQWCSSVSVKTANHEKGDGLFEEHGPNAGTGFFQDLALASQSTSAFIGTGRTSSDLLLELIEFNRITEKIGFLNVGDRNSPVAAHAERGSLLQTALAREALDVCTLQL